MGNTKTLVITGYGINSHKETARACELAGSEEVRMAHFSELLDGSCQLADYGLLVFPGGFLDGDDLGAAQAAAIRWLYSTTRAGQSLLDQVERFLDAGKLVLGICNGFQLLVKIGLLPALDGSRFTRSVSLAHNNSGIYEDRWVHLRANPQSPCIFTQNLPPLYIPVRHGEGRLVAAPEILEKILAQNLIALQYVDPQTGEPTEAYPYNPNGSPLGIAGLTDPAGQILGLMPHPEAFHHICNHPAWTRGKLDPPGTLLFVNAMRYLRSL